MAMMELEVVNKGFKESQSAIIGLENRLKRLVKSTDQGSTSWSTYIKSLRESQREYQKLGVSSKTAREEIVRFVKETREEKAATEAATEAKRKAAAQQQILTEDRKAAAQNLRNLATEQRKTALAEKEIADAHERTRLQLVPGAAATDMLERSYRRLASAFKAGKIDIDEYHAAVLRLENVNLGAQKGMNRFGFAAQQTGYQVGDFLVQIQGGTNPMVAFGQQATQLVGVLYMLPPAALAAERSIFGLKIATTALIAGLGIIIPLVTAVGAYWMRTKEANDKAGKSITKLQENLDSLKESLQEWKDLKEALGAGLSAEQLLGGKGLEAANKRLEDARDRLREIEELQRLQNQSGVADPMGYFQRQSAQKELADAINNEKEAREAVLDISERQAENADKEIQALRDKAAILNLMNKSQVDASALRVMEYGQSLRSIVEEVAARTDLNAGQKAFIAGLEIANLRTQEQIDMREFLKESYYDQLVSMNNELKLLELKSQFGVESAEYRAQEVIQQKAAAEEQIKALGLDSDREKLLINLNNLLIDQTANTNDAAEAAKTLTDNIKAAVSAMGALTNFGLGVEVAIGRVQAEIKAFESGADKTIAGKIYDLRNTAKVERDKAIDAANLAGMSSLPAEMDFQTANFNIDKYEKILALQKSQEDAAREADRKPGGGSQRSKTGISTFVQNLVGTQEGYEAQVAQAEAWKLDALARMQDFNAAELEILREHGGAKFLIEQEYNKQIQDLETAQRNQRLSETASFFGAMASVMQHGGEKMNQVARVLGATEALINTFVAQSQVLKDRNLGFFGKMAAYATIGAAGLGLVSSLRGGGSSGGSSSRSTSTGTIATPTAQETQGPQEVIIKGLSAGMRLSPEELQEIFDQLYEENGKRGTIFQVQI